MEAIAAICLLLMFTGQAIWYNRSRQNRKGWNLRMGSALREWVRSEER